MRCVVTGGAGFLGSHLTDLLLSQGHEVIGIDNFITGNRENIAHLSGNKAYTFIEKDVIEPFDIDGPIDRIYHLPVRLHRSGMSNIRSPRSRSILREPGTASNLRSGKRLVS